MTLVYSLPSLGLLIETGFLLLITRTDLSKQSDFYLGTFIVLFGLTTLASYPVLTNKFARGPVLKGWRNQLPVLDSAPSQDSAPGRKAGLVLIIIQAAFSG